MDILAALKQEQAKLQKQADKVRQQLDAVRAARKILGREVASGGKWQEETGYVFGCESEDWEGNKRAVGKA